MALSLPPIPGPNSRSEEANLLPVPPVAFQTQVYIHTYTGTLLLYRRQAIFN